MNAKDIEAVIEVDKIYVNVVDILDQCTDTELKELFLYYFSEEDILDMLNGETIIEYSKEHLQ